MLTKKELYEMYIEEMNIGKDLNELQKLWLADYKEDFYKWLKERNQKLRNKKLENIL